MTSFWTKDLFLFVLEKQTTANPKANLQSLDIRRWRTDFRNYLRSRIKCNGKIVKDESQEQRPLHLTRQLQNWSAAGRNSVGIFWRLHSEPWGSALRGPKIASACFLRDPCPWRNSGHVRSKIRTWLSLFFDVCLRNEKRRRKPSLKMAARSPGSFSCKSRCTAMTFIWPNTRLQKSNCSSGDTPPVAFSSDGSNIFLTGDDKNNTAITKILWEFPEWAV